MATVVIAANPYEAELCRKALAETGLQVQVAEGGEGLLEMVASRSPLAVVIADGLFCGDMQDLLREVREKFPQTPVFLIAERGGDIPDEAAATWLGARRLFFRPVDIERFADAVEKLAVEAELASEVSEQLEAVHAAEEVAPEIEMEAEFESEPPAASTESINRLAALSASVESSTASPEAARLAALSASTESSNRLGTASPEAARLAALGSSTESSNRLGTASPEAARLAALGSSTESSNRLGTASPEAARLAALGSSIGRVALKQVRREEPIIELPVRRAPTEIIVPHTNGELIPPPASITIPASSSAEGILRADDAMAEEIVTGSFVVEPAPRTAAAGGVVAVETAPFDEPRFTRRLDRELKAAERRLFPDSAGRAPIYDDYDDALGDIDLDSLGIDTMPGIGADALDAALEAQPRSQTAETFDRAPKLVPPRETPSGLHQLANQREETEGERTQVPSLGESGTLSEQDLASLLGSLHASGWTGRCVLQRGDGEKAIYFDNGLPVFATSTLVSDRLGDLLYREGKITREQHARTRELSVEPGRRTAVLFVELGLIKSAELFPALRRHVEEIIYSCFAWDGAAYRLEQEQALPEDKLRLSLHPWALFMEGIRRKYGLMRLVELVGPPETTLAPTTALARAMTDCELNASERVAAELFDGERSLADLMLTLGGLPGVTMSESALYALSWGLIALGAARPVESGQEQAIDVVGVRAVSTLVESASPAKDRRAKERAQTDKPTDRAIDRERLLAKRAQIGDCDYFMVLGVDRQASDHEVRRAYDRLRADFARERFSEPVLRELGDTLDEIQEVLEEAYRVLMDPTLRSAYLSRLPE